MKSVFFHTFLKGYGCHDYQIEKYCKHKKNDCDKPHWREELKLNCAETCGWCAKTESEDPRVKSGRALTLILNRETERFGLSIVQCSFFVLFKVIFSEASLILFTKGGKGRPAFEGGRGLPRRGGGSVFWGFGSASRGVCIQVEGWAECPRSTSGRGVGQKTLGLPREGGRVWQTLPPNQKSGCYASFWNAFLCL